MSPQTPHCDERHNMDIDNINIVSCEWSLCKFRFELEVTVIWI